MGSDTEFPPPPGAVPVVPGLEDAFLYIYRDGAEISG